MLVLAACQVQAAGPSFPCNKTFSGSIEERICRDAGLSALDLQLAGVYAAAEKKPTTNGRHFCAPSSGAGSKGATSAGRART